MKKRLRGCIKWFLLIAAVILLGILFVRDNYPQKKDIVPTPTVVVINEIHYNFPVVGVIDYYIPSAVNVRSEPNFDDSSIITDVEDGTEFTLLGITENGEFFITEYEGQTVFISVKALTIVD